MNTQASPGFLTFQDLILKLQEYWAERGCVIMQPYDMEMGAGTFHPATFLRAVGPEPWSAAYVQPSRRPTDGRYGDNPFRLQHYYQYQVALKPSPDDIQQMYLGSLEEIFFSISFFSTTTFSSELRPLLDSTVTFIFPHRGAV